MDRGEIEIEEVQKEDDWTEKPGWAATSVAILRRGWSLGKRVAIAGAAITSVPVVIPPLIVLSTLGIALSFPFGIYFAGYACADRILSGLLPLSPSKQQLESEDSGEMGFEAFQGEKPMDEIGREAEKSEKDEILDGGVEIEMELGSRSEKERAMGQLGIEEANEVVKFKPVKKVGGKEAVEEEKVKGVKARSDVAAEAGELRKSDDTGSVQGVENEVEQGKEVQEAASEKIIAPKSPFTAVVMAPTGDNIREYEPPNLIPEHLSIVEFRGKEKSNDSFKQVEANEGMKEQMEVGRDEGKRSRSADGVVTEDKELPEGHRSQVGPSHLDSEYVLPTEVASSKKPDAENLEQDGSTEHRNQGKAVPDTVGTFVGVTSVHSDDERTCNEEELWDQILAMRTIVGYKATLHSSLWEELRALYLLTGVKPPVSLTEATDLEEISKNLKLLKGVVGVK